MYYGLSSTTCPQRPSYCPPVTSTASPGWRIFVQHFCVFENSVTSLYCEPFWVRKNPNDQKIQMISPKVDWSRRGEIHDHHKLWGILHLPSQRNLTQATVHWTTQGNIHQTGTINNYQLSIYRHSTSAISTIAISFIIYTIGRDMAIPTMPARTSTYHWPLLILGTSPQVYAGSRKHLALNLLFSELLLSGALPGK